MSDLPSNLEPTNQTKYPITQRWRRGQLPPSAATKMVATTTPAAKIGGVNIESVVTTGRNHHLHPDKRMVRLAAFLYSPRMWRTILRERGGKLQHQRRGQTPGKSPLPTSTYGFRFGGDLPYRLNTWQTWATCGATCRCQWTDQVRTICINAISGNRYGRAAILLQNRRP